MIQKYQTILKILIILFIVMIMLKLCLIFLWPFLISVIITLLLEPVVKLFHNFGVSRKIGVFISIFLFIAFILIIGIYVSKYTYNQTLNFFQNLSQTLVILSNKFSFLSNQKDNYTHILSTIEGIVISYRAKIINTIISTVNGFLYIIIIFMSTIFISIDFEQIINIGKKYLSVKTFKLLSNISFKISKIIIVEAELIFLTTLQTVIGLYILGVNNALTIGIICGILDLLPFIGPAMIFVPWVIYEILIRNIFMAIGLTLLFILLQVIREIMKIKFVGQNFKIHPVITIVSLYIGVVIYGLWGVIIGPVLVILTIELFGLFYERRRLSQL